MGFSSVTEPDGVSPPCISVDTCDLRYYGSDKNLYTVNYAKIAYDFLIEKTKKEQRK